MKCTCDSRDLFNFGCRCKKKEELEVKDMFADGVFITLPKMGHPIPSPDKFISFQDLLTAVHCTCGTGLDDSEKITRVLSGRL